MTGISTSGTSSRQAPDQQLESIRNELKYLQDQVNGRAGFVGVTGGKFPGGLTQGSVVSKAVNGGLMLATVGKGGRIDSQVEITSSTLAFSGYTATAASPTSSEVPQGKFGLHENTLTGSFSLYYNEDGTPVSIGNSSVVANSLALRDSDGSLSAYRLYAQFAVSVGGNIVLITRQSAITDANTAHATASFAAVNTALNALGSKVNEILNRMRDSTGHGLIAG